MQVLPRDCSLRVGTVVRGRFEEQMGWLLDQLSARRVSLDRLLTACRSALMLLGELEAEAKRLAASDGRPRSPQNMAGGGQPNVLAVVAAMDRRGGVASSSSVGAYLGLTPHGCQSCEAT